MAQRPPSRLNLVPQGPVWAGVPNVTEAEGIAIKRLSEADPIAWKFIIERVCRVDAPSFIFDEDGGDRATAFVEGRRSVGLFLRALVALPVENLRKPEKKTE